MNEIKNLLKGEVKTEIGELKNVSFGSDEYKVGVDGLSKLIDKMAEIEKIENEKADKASKLNLDKDRLKVEKDDKSNRLGLDKDRLKLDQERLEAEKFDKNEKNRLDIDRLSLEKDKLEVDKEDKINKLELEGRKFESDRENNKIKFDLETDRLELDEQKFEVSKLENEAKLELEKKKFEAEQTNLSEENEHKKILFEDEKKDKIVKNILTGASIVIPAALTVWGTKKSFKFEEVGTITTQIGRGFINKLLPKK